MTCFFWQIKQILPPCQQRKPETNMVLANVFGRLSSLDLSAGQFPDLEIHNPHPTPKETDNKERISSLLFRWIGIWIKLELGNFIQNSAIGIWIKLDLGNYTRNSLIFLFWNWNLNKIPLANAQKSPGCSSQEWDLEGAHFAKKTKISGNFLVFFSV